MSETEFLIGSMKLVEKYDNDTLESLAERIVKENFPDCKKEFDNETYLEILEDEGYKKFVVRGNDVYKILRKENFEDQDLFLATEREPGIIDFKLRYYNGSCGFDEAINEALDRME